MNQIHGRTGSVLALSIVATVGIGVLAGCGLAGAKGDGPETVDSRTVAAFTRVDVSAGIDVASRIGPVQALEIHAQPNILPLIVASVEGGTLRVRPSTELDPLVAVSIVIVVPRLDGIVLSGDSDGTLTDFAGDRLDVNISGGSDLRASGRAGIVTIAASGGSDATFTDLRIGTLEVELSGGSGVDAQVADEVRGSASGGAHVTVRGDARLNVQASGGAEVGRG